MPGSLREPPRGRLAEAAGRAGDQRHSFGHAPDAMRGFHAHGQADPRRCSSAALVLYGVAPAVLEVLDAWPEVIDIEPYWFAAMIAAQVASWAGMWLLQRLAVDARSWWPVVTSQLASGAFGRVVPGGAAAAGALQYGMLVQAGVPPRWRGSGSASRRSWCWRRSRRCRCSRSRRSCSGVAVPTRLWQAALIGVAVFAALLAIGATLLASDRAVLGVGRLWIRIGSPVAQAQAPAGRPARAAARPARPRPPRARRALVGGGRSARPDAGCSTG